jgi:rhodanese-related sulfurtransferase
VTFFTNYINLALLAIALVSGGMLAAPSLLKRGRGLSAPDATQLINRRNAMVIDVRSADEYGAGHLPQARQLALADLSAKVAQVAKNKKNPVLLVCQTGRTSHKAEAILKEAGYAEVFSLEGGLDAWRQAGLPVVRQQQGVSK